MPVMALQNIPIVTFRMSYLPVCRDSSASIELTRYLGYQADTESAFSSVGKHADNRRHTDIANFAFVESRNVVILACDN